MKQVEKRSAMVRERKEKEGELEPFGEESGSLLSHKLHRPGKAARRKGRED